MAEETRTWAGLSFVRIPKGQFIMGSKEDDELAWDDEKPQHTLELSYDYWAGRFPISVADFREFVQSTAYVTRAEIEGWCWVWNVEEMKWEKTDGANWQHPLGDSRGEETIESHPVVQVCWYDAGAFCDWLNRKHNHELPEGYLFCLPSEAEWEKAARGPKGRKWPWGNEFDPGLCNSRESGRFHTVEIGTCSPQGDSEYGVADMSGNIWEWTITLWGNDRHTPSFGYPYLSQDGREKQGAGEGFFRIIRGGSYKDDLKGVRSACRDIDPPHYSLGNLGFRVFVAPIVIRQGTSGMALEDQAPMGNVLLK
jgi:formylglycine-generating enzyme required for sulfatase activity